MKSQNEFLLKTVFDGKGNYMYHRNCVRAAYGVSTQRLARLRKAIQIQTGEPIEYLSKQRVIEGQRRSDVVLPTHCEQTSRAWVDSQSEDALIPCRKQPTRHGNARKRSNHSKSEAVRKRFVDFVDKNSASNGRKEGSHGKTYYFDRRFTQIRTPNADDPQYEYKCKRSVLYEFNRTLSSDGLGSISVGTMFNWMKKYRPYVGICPSMSDYCDTCKEKNEEISRYRQIITRLIQSGHATQGMAMVYKVFIHSRHYFVA